MAIDLYGPAPGVSALMTPVQVACDGAALKNNGPSTVYYADTPDVTTASYDGSLTSGSTVVLDGNQWFVVAAGARAELAIVAAASPAAATVNVDSYIAVAATAELGVEAAITAATAAGTLAGCVSFTPGKVYSWSARAPQLPRNLAAVLDIDCGWATIKPGATARRAWDWGKVADYDTFQHIRLRRGVVDCESNGGRHHVVIGPWQNGVWQRKINLDDILVEDWKIVNAPVGTDSATDFRIGVHIGMAASVASDTLCTATNVTVRRIDSDACCLQAVAIHGVPVGVETTANVYHDNILVEDIRHNLTSTPTAFNAGSHVMTGTKGTGGRITIRRVRGKNSPDVGIELGAWQYLSVDDCDVEDAYDYAYYHVNYNTVASVEGQQIVLTKAVARRKLLADHGNGFMIGDSGNGNAAVRAASVHFGDGCLYQRLSTSTGFSTVSACGEAVDVYGPRRVSGTIKVACEYPDYNSASTIAPFAVRVRAVDTSTRTIDLLNVEARITGSRSGSGTINWRTKLVRDGLLSGFDFKVLSDVLFTGAGNAALSHVGIGSTSGSCTLSGRVQVEVPSNAGGGNTPVGIQFESEAFNTITSNEQILVHDCSFAGLASTSSDVAYNGTNTLNSGVRYKNNKWRLGPQERLVVSATGATNLDARYDYVAVTATGGAKTISLPSVAKTPVGKVITIADAAGDAATNNITVTVQGASSNTVNGAASKTINSAYGGGTYRCEATGWVQTL